MEPRTETPDSEFIDFLEELVPPSRRGQDSVASINDGLPPVPPDANGPSRWRSPTDSFASKISGYYKISTTCRQCHREGTPSNLYFCSGCGAPRKPAHEKCLLQDPDHEPASSRREHCQEVDFKTYVFMKWLLDVRYLEGSTGLHLDDLKATWFGVPHSQSDSEYPQLFIWNKLRSLVSEAADAPQRQYPSLVSFIGATGSGKSTLIRALIRMLEPVAREDYDAPLPGVNSDMFVSTSSDVHLYADPRTAKRTAPLYFADCEGLSGNDDPMARKEITSAIEAMSLREANDPSDASSSKPNKLRKPTPGDIISRHLETASERPYLRWGRLTHSIDQSHHRPGDPRRARNARRVNRETRTKIVTQLYPRLLYAFSDVVCFVQNSTRESEEMFDTLFDWAKQGHEKTLNQRIRPGLIIVLNKSTETVHDALSNPDKATEKMLRAYESLSRFREMQRMWRKRGRRVETARDLIHCYYYAFKVISIPTYSSSPPVANQTSESIKTLYRKIRDMSDCIREKRKSYNMDLDTSSFNSYMEKAAKKLAVDLNSAIDFHHIQMSSGDSRLPNRFSEHLLQLMSNMVRMRGLDQSNEIGGEAQLVEDLIRYIASCIAAQVQPNPDSTESQHTLRILVDEARLAIQQFREKFWRCEAQNQESHLRCRNYWESHEKCHQFSIGVDASSHSQVLADGGHLCSYDGEMYFNRLWEEVIAVVSRTLDGDSVSKRELAEAAQAIGINQIQSHRTCLACLSNCPTNMLPCKDIQHAICEQCLRRYTGRYESSWAHLRECPLGCQLLISPWKIRVKPETAGSRVLALDGGGVRGIVELRILSRLQKEVGFGIKIQELFDLVTGTSTGGIVALGVFVEGWTLGEATKRFKQLATRAFEKRRALRIPVYASLAVPFCTYKYKSEGIESALKSSFGNNYLFGQNKGAPQSPAGSLSSCHDQVKVGVVACIDGRQQPCLLANYSRNPLSYGAEEDILQREDQQDGDFRTWQAARATSAAQTFFKPYVHKATSRAYVDGAVVRNNPVRVAYDESQKIWPSCRPDIVISIGTGIMVDDGGTPIITRSPLVDGIKPFIPGRLVKMAEAGMDMVGATLSCDRAWDDFQQSQSYDRRLVPNLHRLDVGLEHRPPKVDAVDDMLRLAEESDYYLQQAPGVRFRSRRPIADQMFDIAQRLRATLFWFSVPIDGNMEGGLVTGRIHCRLSPQSEGVGPLLTTGRPLFRSKEVMAGNRPQYHDVKKLTGFDEATLSASVEVLVTGGNLRRVIEVKIHMPGRGDSEWEPISGF